jgi:hypothetical protein
MNINATLSRRRLLERCSAGFGAAALAGLLGSAARGATAGSTRWPAGRPHFAPRARHVIFCYMSGGVSHLDSLDPKPRLTAEHGKPMPVPVHRTMFNNNGNIMGSPWAFHPRGRSGLPVSDLFPHIARCADDLAVIRSMTSKVSEHAQGNYFIHTGFPFMGHPSAGAWASYGLSTDNANLPGFVVLQSLDAVPPHGGVGLYSSGYLPAQHQASILKVDGEEALPNIKPRQAEALQRARLDYLRDVDSDFLRGAAANDAQVDAAIRNYETAFRMQAAVPELCDLAGEPGHLQEAYGLNHPHKQTAAYARQCMVARRLVERGVRFVELSCLNEGIGAGNAANPWDQHSKLKEGHGAMALQVDQPIAALLKDLKQRGLLESTLVIFSGEFGRTPFSQGTDGRDHNPYGFSLWLAGAGVKGGFIHGATDDYGYHAVENPLTLYDLWATVLHLLGVDHEQLTYRFGGRDFRLTDVHGHVIRPLLA